MPPSFDAAVIAGSIVDSLCTQIAPGGFDRGTFTEDLPTMIPAIGVMIGCYIIVRMFELLVLHPRTVTFGIVKAFAIVTILVCVLGMVELVTGSVSMANLSGADRHASSPF